MYLRLISTLLCVIIEVTFSSLLCCKLKIMGIFYWKSWEFCNPQRFSLLSMCLFYKWCPQSCKHQRFLFCLSMYLFSEWHIVPLLYIQIKQSRTRSRKALSGWKASRRLGKQIRVFSGFCLKPTHHNNAFTMQNEEIYAFYAVFWENPVIYGILRIIFRTFAAK